MAARYTPSMKAAVQTRYGPPEVVLVSEVDKPTARDNEVLVKVHATTVNRTDCACRAAKPFFMRRRRRRRWPGSRAGLCLAGPPCASRAASAVRLADQSSSHVTLTMPRTVVLVGSNCPGRVRRVNGALRTSMLR